jgi:hypothetical protein
MSCVASAAHNSHRRVIERLVTLDGRQGSGLFVEYRVCARLWTHSFFEAIGRHFDATQLEQQRRPAAMTCAVLRDVEQDVRAAQELLHTCHRS